MKPFFLFCSGANVSVLEECPTEVSKYAGIGVTILLTAVLATLSGGYALFTVFRSVPAAVVFGILWGLVIFNLDRVIVSGMRKQKHGWMELLYGLPRLGISVLLAVVISRPLELKLFEKEIRNQWVRMQLDARGSDAERIRAGDGGRLEGLRRENARLNGEVEAKRAEYKAANDAWIREKEGTGGTGIPGAGPVFAQRDEARREVERQMRDVESRNLPLITRNDAEIRRLEAEQNRLIAETDNVRDASLGFLASMEAFGQLQEESSTIWWASLLITLLFISLETAPVMVKLLATRSPYRPYDELLEQREFEIVEQVRQNMRARRHAIKADADRAMDEYTAALDTEIILSSGRNRQRLDAELRTNETLIQRIADAQSELAARLVVEWKRSEMEKIERGIGAYAG